MSAITHRQAIADIARALRYIRPIRRLFAGKLGYSLVALVPAVFFPWPSKVLVDHVIQGLPIDPAGYPFFFRPVVVALEGATPAQMAFAMLAFSLLLLGLFGGTGTPRRATRRGPTWPPAPTSPPAPRTPRTRATASSAAWSASSSSASRCGSPRR